MAIDNFRRVDFTLDKANGYIPSDQFAKENDNNGRELTVQITDGGVIKDQSSLVLTLAWKHDTAGNEGQTLFTRLNGGQGIFTVAYDNAMMIPGIVTACIQIVDGERITNTRNFKLRIENNPLNVDKAVAEDSFKVFVDALAGLTKYDGRIAYVESEVATARGGYANLNAREDVQDNAIIAAQSTANGKFDTNQAEAYLKSITALPETFANLSAIKANYPSGKNGLMVAADNGHKYIWANSTWTDAGVYQSVGIADNSIIDKKIAAPAKSGAYLLPTKPVDFDFVRKIITISKGSLLGVGQRATDPLASDVLVPFSENAAQILLFNQETKVFRAVATYQTDLMTADEVILARYHTNPTVQRVSANFDYTVNGSAPNTANIAGSTFISVITDSKITYDFVNKQVVVPASLAFFAANMHYYATDWNPAKVDLVIPFPPTGASFKLVFNQKTKSFSILNFSTIITTSQTIVSVFNVSTELIVQFDNLFTKLSAKQGSNITEPLPDYVNAEISRVNDEVIALAGPDKLIIAWQTDVHNYDSHIRALVQLQRLGQLDYIINGGDLSYESPPLMMRAKFDSQKLLMEPSKTPWITIRGNHDGSGTISTISEITNSEFNRRMNWNQTIKKMWIDDGTGNGYGYIDDDKHKIRMIFINDAAIDDEQHHRLGIDDVQLKWIIEHALDLSEKSDDEKNWQVLMFGHVPIDGAFTTGAIAQGADVLEAGIVAFKTGTIYTNESLDISCDFKQPHTFIAFVNGHMHFDQLGINGQGFMEVCTASSQPDHFTSSDRLTPDATSPERTLNDATEDCWDILVIDPAKKHVDLVRYGAGENRKFDY